MKADLINVKQRNVVTVDKTTGILKNGADNAYPSRMERIINASNTAKAAANMYASFLVGGGFVDENLNKIVVGKNLFRDITLYDLLEKIAISIAYQNGAYLHARFNANYKIDSFQFFHYKNCRFSKPDDTDYSAKILYYNNWDKTKGNFKKDDVREYNIFNTNTDVIKAQILKAGSVEKYKGQIAPIFLNDDYIYPLSPIDVAQDDADTEYQISMFKNGELSRNFFAKYIIKHAYFADEQSKREFINMVSGFMGAENNAAVMLAQGDISTDQTGEIIDDTFKLEKVEQNINDKLFVEWEQSIANNIRKSFKAIPKILIDAPEGIFGGQSGEAFKAAAKFYNEMTKNDRQKISNYFKELFSIYKTPISSDFEIKTLTFE